MIFKNIRKSSRERKEQRLRLQLIEAMKVLRDKENMEPIEKIFQSITKLPESLWDDAVKTCSIWRYFLGFSIEDFPRIIEWAVTGKRQPLPSVPRKEQRNEPGTHGETRQGR